MAGMALLLAAAGCTIGPSPSPDATPTERPEPDGTGTVAASPSTTAVESPSAEPTAAPSPSAEPPLSLEPPAESDSRVVSVTVSPEVPPDGDGRILVSVTSQADTRIDELVLRWPEELGETLSLAPFAPSPERIVDGGDPLVQAWTKWVLGPGEQGEPAGTVSLGWGPLLPGATLQIPILVTRRAPGPVEFDLQVLAGNALLTDPDGGGLEIRVGVD
jgi:hypothetical protein